MRLCDATTHIDEVQVRAETARWGLNQHSEVEAKWDSPKMDKGKVG